MILGAISLQKGLQKETSFHTIRHWRLVSPFPAHMWFCMFCIHRWKWFAIDESKRAEAETPEWYIGKCSGHGQFHASCCSKSSYHASRSSNKFQHAWAIIYIYIYIYVFFLTSLRDGKNLQDLYAPWAKSPQVGSSCTYGVLQGLSRKRHTMSLPQGSLTLSTRDSFDPGKCACRTCLASHPESGLRQHPNDAVCPFLSGLEKQPLAKLSGGRCLCHLRFQE